MINKNLLNDLLKEKYSGCADELFYNDVKNYGEALKNNRSVEDCLAIDKEIEEYIDTLIDNH